MSRAVLPGLCGRFPRAFGIAWQLSAETVRRCQPDAPACRLPPLVAAGWLAVRLSQQPASERASLTDWTARSRAQQPFARRPFAAPSHTPHTTPPYHAHTLATTLTTAFCALARLPRLPLATTGHRYEGRPVHGRSLHGAVQAAAAAHTHPRPPPTPPTPPKCTADAARTAAGRRRRRIGMCSMMSSRWMTSTWWRTASDRAWGMTSVTARIRLYVRSQHTTQTLRT